MEYKPFLTANYIRLQEKLRRDVPGGSDAFYEKWADYIWDLAHELVQTETIETIIETCSGCPADDLEADLNAAEEKLVDCKLNHRVLELVPKYA